MSPAYLHAVEAVRWGPGVWAILILPAVAIWSSAILAAGLFHEPQPRHAFAAGYLTFPLAFVLFWGLYVTHAQRIQDTKLRHMRSDAEWQDWSSDTWRVFAPIVAVPAGLIYCTTHQVLATSAAAGVLLFRRRRQAAVR